MSRPQQVQLSHGGGGREMNDFIHNLFFRRFENPLLKAEDAATFTLNGPVAMTTDSFTVEPLFFAGGNIGSLAIAGTTNDLAMVAAQPKYLTCSFILEEGFPFSDLERIVDTMAKEIVPTGAQIVCGDTKVVPKGCADKVFINTTGIGEIVLPNVSASQLQPTDVLLVSRDIGRHGACVLAARESLRLESEIESDCAALWPIVNTLLNKGITPRAMRDATRGGLSAVLNEWCQSSNVQMRLDEQAIPVDTAVKGVCELFGFEPYDLANEGTFILAVPAQQAQDALSVLLVFQSQAAIIGEVTQGSPAKPILCSPWGSKRYLDFPVGELLPRIC
ncbi:hydrogenase expression/formation protein HypE [Vibrio nitrifigilis]|uniref:Hydrogenase expression/formation protein HypE n=1 Tax=Vibrio nitrifigilis TaxID=2789781 RepID=A0ABS0GGA9_9VIBR|nr:hydrogenase expression/formation protein HypE [Vibrio nitrifigilis]MBF9001444.1 hydrogenase expression/formation protein HypE [Vibrio nitrifigilis]